MSHLISVKKAYCNYERIYILPPFIKSLKSKRRSIFHGGEILAFLRTMTSHITEISKEATTYSSLRIINNKEGLGMASIWVEFIGILQNKTGRRKSKVMIDAPITVCILIQRIISDFIIMVLLMVLIVRILVIFQRMNH